MRLSFWAVSFWLVIISIHAPARGATFLCLYVSRIHAVSIHAPARGATKHTLVIGSAYSLFQSTHSRGVRLLCESFRQVCPCFNPRTREGCDARRVGQRHGHLRFQSTHPRGVRPVAGHRLCPGPFGFNPRTREGCDLHSSGGPRHFGEFQSTHPRGVRPRASAARTAARSRFNPRTREGCDQGHPSVLHRHQVSIHAPARGATAGTTTTAGRTTCFNPRTREGCDLSNLLG